MSSGIQQNKFINNVISLVFVLAEMRSLLWMQVVSVQMLQTAVVLQIVAYTLIRQGYNLNAKHMASLTSWTLNHPFVVLCKAIIQACISLALQITDVNAQINFSA